VLNYRHHPETAAGIATLLGLHAASGPAAGSDAEHPPPEDDQLIN
jgi:hypothetical protein